jgi:enoyl-CoA hydratase/carnithine racemase
MSDLVLVKQNDQIVEIILNRPDKRNAMNITLVEELDAAMDAIEKLTSARVIILRGEGKVFSAGIDLMGFVDSAGKFGENWQNNLFPLTAFYQGVLNKVERSSLPVIALLHGYCVGLGMELALACDIRIAAEGMQMGLPEARLGLIPDVGGTTRLTHLIGPGRAKELIMTGRNFDMACADKWGIVNHVVPQDELYPRGLALAEELIAAAPLSVSYAKRIINGVTDVERGLQQEAWAQSVLIRTEDFHNGAQAMLTKEKPDWKGK